MSATTSAPPRRGRRRPRRWADGALVRLLAPVVAAVLVLVAWEVFVRVGDVQPYLLPAPSAIGEQLAAGAPQVLSAALATGANALVGLVGGSLLGMALALLAVRSRWLRDALVPLAAAANAVPIVALAPLLYLMFSSTSEVPRRVVVGVVVLFPVFVNALRGLAQVSPVHAELMRSYAVSSWAVTRTVRLPGALPFVFTGLRLASSLAVIAAVVAEYFGGLQTGLGARITSAAAQSAYPRAWAYVVGACALGVLFYVAALALERLVTPHARPR
ncbi:ABC transporter permease [Pseudokineococcus sp. 1T1Z-3]|uniref:ABC transporter permease n=1 Tax=Pseudokineococcus sp. 1T1Z-3 TaxID=3132745 RepID=UPI00309D3BA7